MTLIKRVHRLVSFSIVLFLISFLMSTYGIEESIVFSTSYLSTPLQFLLSTSEYPPPAPGPSPDMGGGFEDRFD